jgi:hypothetical protein
MNDLLLGVLDAHGGVDRWARVHTITAHLSIGGPPWDALQVGYFISYACWNYLTAPFLFTYPGVETRELEPCEEDGETWRRLHVTFPRSIATHSTEQVFYYGADFMQRRMDYAVEVNGDVLVAQYQYEPKTFHGLVFPTQRRVHRRNADGTAERSQTSITLDITEMAIDSDEPPSSTGRDTSSRGQSGIGPYEPIEHRARDGVTDGTARARQPVDTTRPQTPSTTPTIPPTRAFH